ncbi:hypothetical protein ZWY2020_036377 [Hordeum vulgare]|nr:hypothetical protein ZWY2020_036377 [Hordeum vulgare]
MLLIAFASSAEWCEVISDPAFIVAHMVHGPRALTHTVVFFLGRRQGAGGANAGAIEPQSGHGYLLDEHWRLVARFTAGESEDMVGTCNGLLCLVDFHQGQGQGGIRVVEPLTGESLFLPRPETQRWYQRGAYCFGFDPSSRRYKILHQGRDLHKDDTTEKDLYVYTIGGGDKWRRTHEAAAVMYEDPVFADGSVWSIATDQNRNQPAKVVVRFDLAMEEEIMSSEPMELVDWGTAWPVMTTASDAPVYAVDGWLPTEMDVFLMGQCGRWA